MRIQRSEIQRGPSTITAKPFLVVDPSRSFENAEDVDMQQDALLAIRAYKSATDRLMAETYAELAGKDFDVRTACTLVQKIWVKRSAAKAG